MGGYMRNVTLAIMAVLIMAGSAWAIDTALTSPLVIVEPAITMRQFSFTIIPSQNQVRAEMQFLDASGEVVKTRECEFVASIVTNAVIAEDKVGQKYIDVLMQAIHNKCKDNWSISGEDN